MTTEQKAKAYDEALKLARDYHEDKNCFEYLKGVLENIFYELKESEDERTRKELIAEVKHQIEYIPAPDCRDKEDEKTLKQLNSWLAWLEKQDDKDTFIKEELECIKGYRENAIKRLKELEQQGKQKPKWTEEDEKVFNNLIGGLIRISHHTFTDCTSPNYTFFTEIEWLKSIKQRMEVKQ